jgi:hypothetical protein
MMIKDTIIIWHSSWKLESRRDVHERSKLYSFAGVSGVPTYSTTNNAHYEALEAQGVDLKDNLVAVSQSSLNGLPELPAGEYGPVYA